MRGREGRNRRWRKAAARVHRGGEEGLAGGIGGEVQHGVSRLLGGQSQGGKGVHDEIEPQHLHRCQGGLLDCNGTNARRADCHYVHRQLQQTQVESMAWVVKAGWENETSCQGCDGHAGHVQTNDAS